MQPPVVAAMKEAFDGTAKSSTTKTEAVRMSWPGSHQLMTRIQIHHLLLQKLCLRHLLIIKPGTTKKKNDANKQEKRRSPDVGAMGRM